ncbi:hypothetical protein KCP76_26175 (plasmid) [Salmonella enterica subsp. enterica serovar Weltevreden]|nr:hypothetical protein KCP76_26175 [Salmonella enterica subsp. enterica serovar Weltevreden]
MKRAADTVADFRRSTGKKSGDMKCTIAEQDMLTTIQTRLKAMAASRDGPGSRKYQTACR